MLIGISGASGSGKTHFSRKLYARLRQELLDVKLLCEDRYYRDQGELSFEERTRVNYDHPDALEHSLLIKQIEKLARGIAVETPVYDYGHHTRSDETDIYKPAQVLIVEGILILHPARLRQLFDMTIFVDTCLDVCLQRRIKRDAEERNRSRESVIRQFEDSVRPMFHEFVEPTRDYADVVVKGSGNVESAVEKIVAQAIEMAE